MRKKTKRFEENKNNPYIIEEGKPLFNSIKGQWREKYFKNNNNITLELGAGRGEYSTTLAEIYPKENFIGIDIKGDRLWFGGNIAMQKELNNVIFLRTQIEKLSDFFIAEEVDKIWITFPGPRPKKTQANKRLTNNKFLDIYKNILSKNGTVNLKTDSDLLFNYTLNVLNNRNDIVILTKDKDIYSHELTNELSIKTRFENNFLVAEKTIKYIKFKFK